MNDIRDAFTYQGKALVANAIVFGGVLVLQMRFIKSKLASKHNMKKHM